MRKQLIAADAVLTMDASNRVIVGGGVLVEGARIAAVGEAKALAAAHPDAALRPFKDHVLLPGLINAHAHSGLLRGTAEHLPVWDWLTRHINPMHRVLNAEEAEAAAWLCYAESALCGVTTIVDMWRFLEGGARAARQLGTRLVAVPYVGEHPDYDYFERLDGNEALIDAWDGGADGRINVWVGLEHWFYADERGQRRAIDLAVKRGVGFHLHCSEAEIEVGEFVSRYGRRPMQVLCDAGVFEAPRTLIAHAVWLDEEEIALIAGARVGVAHNPVSNLKLASGIAPVDDFLKAGVPVGLGTDGEKENNNFDLFEEMKTASLIGKLRHRDAAALDSWRALEMATIRGAMALGMAEEIGSLEPGKRADLIAVRADTPRMTPFFAEGPYFNLQHNLVHAVRGSDVALTMVNGAAVVENGELVNADLKEIVARARAAAPPLFARRAAWLAQANANKQWTQGA